MCIFLEHTSDHSINSVSKERNTVLPSQLEENHSKNRTQRSMNKITNSC
jgi:hypothetical protein